jgi:hypothetical protein
MGRSAARTRTCGPYRLRGRTADALHVEEPSLAELLPELYRQVLDRVAALEQHDHRPEAGRVRAEATRAYSGPWNSRAVGRLRTLRIHAERVVAGRERPRAQSPIASALARLSLVRTV